MLAKQADTFQWRPPNGESIEDLCLRVDRVFATFARECAEQNVIAVCHGEFMWACRVRLERMLPQRFLELDQSDRAEDHIHNGQILHYSRVNPSTGIESHRYEWMRSICPWDTSLSYNDWQSIERPTLNNETLLNLVNEWPQLIND